MTKSYLREASRRVRVIDYFDCRLYLRALYDDVRARVSPYSYLHFAEDLGFAMTNVVRLMIAGKRPFTRKAAERIIDALDIRNEERRFFLALIDFQRERSETGRAEALQKMIKLKESLLGSDEDKDRLEYFSRWYHPVLRELTAIPALISTPESIHDQLHYRLSLGDISTALELLQRLKLIVRDEESGRFVPSKGQQSVTPSDKVAGDIAFVGYHQEMLNRASEAINAIPQEEREINAVTLCVSERVAEILKRKIQQLCSEATELEHLSDTPERVYQLNVQFFPFSKRIKKESGS